ncbi:hypothetical protein FACS189472_18250 [Alphaproteobacteria bacterium]|nr:hypothetical protein FACS189472_18250 [Alphaproteobacteria bacterium]
MRKFLPVGLLTFLLCGNCDANTSETIRRGSTYSIQKKKLRQLQKLNKKRPQDKIRKKQKIRVYRAPKRKARKNRPRNTKERQSQSLKIKAKHEPNAKAITTVPAAHGFAPITIHPPKLLQNPGLKESKRRADATKKYEDWDKEAKKAWELVVQLSQNPPNKDVLLDEILKCENINELRFAPFLNGKQKQECLETLVNARYSDGNSLLHKAILNNCSLKQIEFLVRCFRYRKAINTRNNEGSTALELAKKQGRKEVVELLSNNNASGLTRKSGVLH